MKLISPLVLAFVLLPSARLFAEVSTNTPSPEPNSFLQVVASQFARWDLDHDGTLSEAEIDAAVANPGTTNQNAAAIAALKRASRSNRNPVPALTLENIQKLTADKRPDLAKMFQEGWTRILGATNRALFADGLPKLETIHQGRLGNCFCLAPLGAIVHRDPQQVVSMFSPLTNGGYRVKFGKHTVEVAPPTDAELAMTASNDHDGIWVNIYEKAVGEARNEDKPPEERAASPLDALARGGSAGTMLAYITGHDIKRFSFKFAKGTNENTAEFTNQLADLRQELSLATAQNRLMDCGTAKTTTPDISPNHAYAVFRYEPATDSVQLWNPHGEDHVVKGKPGPEHGYPTKSGVFWIPVPEFVKEFAGMSFEVTEATAKP